MMTEEKIAQMVKELQSNLCELVVAGEMTELEANEWANMKADQWNAESEAQG